VRAAGAAPYRSNRSGNVRFADSRTFKVSTTVAAALETIKPGGLREMHWLPNADEWQYWVKGQGRGPYSTPDPHAMTMDFHAGDIGVVKRNYDHYIQNTGTTDAQILAVSKTAQYEEVSLSDAHAARTRGATPEYRCIGRAGVPEQRPGIPAGLTRGTQRRAIRRFARRAPQTG
jgi:oxalate decarboxylase/phosphoglucose isomerase-like protein (cupin superfamily)